MAKKTANYNLHKIDLADSPPDITMINPNWDEIDSLLKSLSDALGGIDLTTIQHQLTQHLAEKNNPHGVTKTQVGLGSVQNYGVATQAEAEAGTSAAKYMTPERTSQAIDKKLTPLNETFTQHLDENNGKHVTESGNNANGNYIKFDDGTMICYRLNLPFTFNGKIGSESVTDLPLPATFNGTASFGYAVVASPLNLNGRIMASGLLSTASNATWQLATLSQETANISGYNLNLFAIGRWK